jgi:hypothetical protein
MVIALPDAHPVVPSLTSREPNGGVGGEPVGETSSPPCPPRSGRWSGSAAWRELGAWPAPTNRRACAVAVSRAVCCLLRPESRRPIPPSAHAPPRRCRRSRGERNCMVNRVALSSGPMKRSPPHATAPSATRTLGFCGRDCSLGRPPHRSQRALLAHWAPASGANVKAHDRERVHRTDRWQPPLDVQAHPMPVDRVRWLRRRSALNQFAV